MRRVWTEPVVHVMRVADVISTSGEQTERVQFGVRLDGTDREQTDIFL